MIRVNYMFCSIRCFLIIGLILYSTIGYIMPAESLYFNAEDAKSAETKKVIGTKSMLLKI